MLHLAILLGGFAAMALHSPAWALVVLVAIKTAMDVRAHRREHRADPQTNRPARELPPGTGRR